MVYKYKGTKNIPLLKLLKQLSYIELTLKYDAQLYNYIYSLLFIDTENALPILPNDDSVIEW
ncbi:hypothetical protein CTM45_12370 [Prevotella intermedia]|uniref:Uncharacterized protein n=1 Tax=Prevotella intermedia TaxID=28131 RepID=A0A2D3LNB7_PREIN|nr:hypothetical protein CTM46_11395 [Prevotella intermedia]PJI21576.1 hypothetical protein CTM45_12370 [Prevotella intermedia]